MLQYLKACSFSLCEARSVRAKFVCETIILLPQLMGLVITQAVPTIQRQNITKETIKSFLFYQFCVLHANTNLKEE